MQFQLARGEASGRWLLLAAAALVALGLLWRGVLLELLGIAFGAAALAFLLSPLAKLLEKKLPRGAAAGAALGLAALALLGAVSLALPALARQLSALMELLPEALERVQSLMAALGERIQRRSPGIALPELDFSSLEPALTEALRKGASWFSSLSGGVYRFILMAALSCTLLADRARLLLRLELLVPQRLRAMAVRASDMFLRQLRLYLRGQATIALAVGMLAALGFLLIGLPGAPLLGLLVGALNVIPYLGPVLGGIPAVATALGLGWERALMTLAILLGVQQIDGMVISPRVMGGVTGFSPAVVLLALFAGANLAGVTGLLLALPAMMAVRCAWRAWTQR